MVRVQNWVSRSIHGIRRKIFVAVAGWGWGAAGAVVRGRRGQGERIQGHSMAIAWGGGIRAINGNGGEQ